LADSDSKREIESDSSVSDAYPKACRILTTLNFCLSKIVGKYAAYPDVDSAAYRRIHSALSVVMTRQSSTSALGDYCQELRAVATCPVSELLRPREADDVDTRITAIAQVVRQHTGIDDTSFRELLTGLLSWSLPDKMVILETLVGIIRGQS